MSWSFCLAEGKEEKKYNNPFMSRWYYIWACTRKDKTVWTWKAIYWRRQFGVCRSSGLCTPNSEMPSYQLTTWNDKTLMPLNGGEFVNYKSQQHRTILHPSLGFFSENKRWILNYRCKQAFSFLYECKYYLNTFYGTDTTVYRSVKVYVWYFFQPSL